MVISDEVCPQAMCTLLPFGFLLLTFDLFHDLQYITNPSQSTERKLKSYYMNILTPKLWLPWPGIFFPLYVIYIFVGICSDWVCYGLFLCYVPLCKRYYDIHKGRDDLRSWWYVIAIRFIMALLTYKGLENRGCQLEEYPNYVSIFLESHSWL